MKVIYCRRAYDTIRIVFNEMCGSVVDGGNAVWFGLAMYILAAIFMFFFSLQLLHAVRLEDNRVQPRREALVDLDRPTTPTDQEERQPASFRVPGKTHGDWLQDPDERERRRHIVT